jgi:DNA-binding transcriptional LysR family regulator
MQRGRRVAFRDLPDQDFVGLAANNARQQHLGQHAIQAGRPLQPRVRLGRFDAIARMVESGVGIAVIPETAARRCRKTMEIRISRLTDPWSLRHLHLCVRNPVELPSPARRLLDHLTHHSRNE